MARTTTSSGNDAPNRNSTRAIALLCALLAALGATACWPDGFRCGEHRPGTQETRVCDGAREICVCASRSCAVEDLSCASRYRYLDEPFAHPEGPPGALADGGTDPNHDRPCVAEQDLEWTVSSSDPLPVCSASDAAAEEEVGEEAIEEGVAE